MDMVPMPPPTSWPIPTTSCALPPSSSIISSISSANAPMCLPEFLWSCGMSGIVPTEMPSRSSVMMTASPTRPLTAVAVTTLWPTTSAEPFRYHKCRVCEKAFTSNSSARRPEFVMSSNPRCVDKRHAEVEEKIDFNGADFPTPLQQTRLFENHDPDVSVKVYSLNARGKVVPTRVTKKEKNEHIDILMGRSVHEPRLERRLERVIGNRRLVRIPYRSTFHPTGSKPTTGSDRNRPKLLRVVLMPCSGDEVVQGRLLTWKTAAWIGIFRYWTVERVRWMCRGGGGGSASARSAAVFMQRSTSNVGRAVAKPNLHNCPLISVVGARGLDWRVCTSRCYSICVPLVVPTRWMARAGENGRSLRKPTDQWHRPTRVPLEIRERSRAGNRTRSRLRAEEGVVEGGEYACDFISPPYIMAPTSYNPAVSKYQGVYSKFVETELPIIWLLKDRRVSDLHDRCHRKRTPRKHPGRWQVSWQMASFLADGKFPGRWQVSWQMASFHVLGYSDNIRVAWVHRQRNYKNNLGRAKRIVHILFKQRVDLKTTAQPISTLASHQGEPGSIPGQVTGISQVRIVPDDAVGLRVFSGNSRFPRPIIPKHGRKKKKPTKLALLVTIPNQHEKYGPESGRYKLADKFRNLQLLDGGKMLRLWRLDGGKTPTLPDKVLLAGYSYASGKLSSTKSGELHQRDNAPHSCALSLTVFCIGTISH
ncbi:hypothetical protein PR048_014331 [Dryococelus australis]|uniref:Uncharacterized protein n=1 Tax=Dryococelus australis TaxID=614101 RepID=A0ABQ9HE44_9NEOP|nr:hypothetical protein PR048_014331 [Dryococelus australis]